VAQRTRELGVRLALGATPRELVRMVTRETVGVVVAGCIVGLVAGTLLSRILTGLLFGVSRLDPLTFLGCPVLLTVVAGTAAWVAARRAASVGPAEALRLDSWVGSRARSAMATLGEAADVARPEV
jgi:ABC-type antimicrobial peptide transport system permease subunit